MVDRPIVTEPQEAPDPAECNCPEVCTHDHENE